MHKVLNCGSAIQAYALQYFIEKIGHKAEIIDYEYPNKYHKSIRPIGYRNIFIRLIDKLYTCLNNYYLQQRFRPFYKACYKLSKTTYTSIDSIKQNPPLYDIYVSGSDQVWNPKYVGEDTTFLLDFVHGKRKVSYSSSIATKNIDSNIECLYSKCLKDYSSISVREELSRNYIEKLSGKRVEFVLDPSLLLTPQEWTPILNLSRIKIKSNYILVYILGYSFDIYSYSNKLINYLEEKTGYKIVLFIYSRAQRKKLHRYQTINAISPQNFLCLIKNASLVVTDSFHATATSLNFSVPLYPLIKDKNNSDNRVYSILKSVGAEDWAIEKDTPFPILPSIIKDYSIVSNNLEYYRKKSVNYLINALS